MPCRAVRLLRSIEAAPNPGFISLSTIPDSAASFIQARRQSGFAAGIFFFFAKSCPVMGLKHFDQKKNVYIFCDKAEATFSDRLAINYNSLKGESKPDILYGHICT